MLNQTAFSFRVISGFIARHFSLISQRLLPPPCLLCGASLFPGDRFCLCIYCLQGLPYLTANKCGCCSLPLETQAAYCGECLRNRPAFTGTAIPFQYAHPLDVLIQNFKYHQQLCSGRSLGALLLNHLQEQLSLGKLQAPDKLVPVPIHWKKRWQRGFNQAEILAEYLGEKLGIPVVNACRRKKPSHNQKDLGRFARQKNLHNVFNLPLELRAKIAGKHLALVDDVVTTGATARVLSELLLKSGAARVDIWALARTPGFGGTPPPQVYSQVFDPTDFYD